MEKVCGSNRRKFKIIFFCIMLLCVFIINLDVSAKGKSLKKQNQELSLKVKSLKEEYEKLLIEEVAKEADISSLQNIDENIKKLKEEVFEKASLLETKIRNKETSVKIAYITFDDGPYYNTYKVLDILDKYQIKATFFTIGSGKTKCYDNSKYDCTKLYAEITTRGHTIANHTYSHKIFGTNRIYTSASTFITQIVKQENYLRDKTGVITNITRFPGGSSTAGNLKSSIIAALRDKGYGWVDWTAQDGDGGTLNSKTQAWSNFTKSINENIEVVLFHDYSAITTNMLPEAIEYLQKNNYVILPLFYNSVMINK